MGITSHEAQAWDTVLSHFDVVASLEGFLAWAVEVGVLNRVCQEDRIATLVAGHPIRHAAFYTDVVEWRVTVYFLEGQGNGVCFEERVSRCQRESGVADITCQRPTGIGGAIEVEVEVQALIASHWQGVVEVGVVLVPDILELGTVQGCSQVVVDGIFATQIVDALGPNVSVGGSQSALKSGVVRAAAAVEMTAFKIEVFDFTALQLETTSGLLEQTAAANGEYWCRGRGEVAECQLGFGDANADVRACFTEAVVDAIGAMAQVAGAGMVIGTVKLESRIAKNIDTYTDCTLGKAKAEFAQYALAPVFLVIVTVILIGPVEVVVLQNHASRSAFNETLGVRLRGYERVGHSHLGTCCGNSQGDHAPLHHAHRDLLLWF